MIEIYEANTETIEPALDLLDEMNQLHIDRMPEIFNHDLSTDREFHRSFLDNQKDGKFALVALENNEVVGACFLDVQELPEFYKERRVIMIEAISVREDFRCRGIASQLINEAEKIAKNLGIKWVRGEVFPFNTASQQMNKRNDYNVIFEVYQKDISVSSTHKFEKEAV